MFTSSRASLFIAYLKTRHFLCGLTERDCDRELPLPDAAGITNQPQAKAEQVDHRSQVILDRCFIFKLFNRVNQFFDISSVIWTF